MLLMPTLYFVRMCCFSQAFAAILMQLQVSHHERDFIQSDCPI